MSNECVRCGNEPLADYICLNCGYEEVTEGDESYFTDDSNFLYGYDSSGEANQIKCSKCQGETFDVSYHDYCSYCAHQIEKDD